MRGVWIGSQLSMMMFLFLYAANAKTNSKSFCWLHLYTKHILRFLNEEIKKSKYGLTIDSGPIRDAYKNMKGHFDFMAECQY